jgi:hypothetical protein
VIITNSNFSKNRGSLRAGAVFVDASSTALIEHCSFSENASPYGGAIRCSDSANAQINNCDFIKNGSKWGITCLNGGAFYAIRTGSLKIYNCKFLGNVADSAGAVCLDGNPGTAVVANCIFAGNIAATGGGMRIYSSSTDITNCTFYTNTAATGRSITVQTTGLLKTVNNSILWEGGNEIYGNNGTMTINSCDIQGGWSGSGSNNFSSDPFFISPEGIDGVIGTIDDDYRLYSDSECIDRGGDSYVPEDIYNDIQGFPRINGLTVDLGAYEQTLCGDAGYPFPMGDLDYNCVVNFNDLAILASNWLTCSDIMCD